MRVGNKTTQRVENAPRNAAFRAAHAHRASKWRPGPTKSSEICFNFDKFAKVWASVSVVQYCISVSKPQ
ncbi:hypothetical protein AOLI_G00155780 [Acnodon oligacanthus]